VALFEWFCLRGGGSSGGTPPSMCGCDCNLPTEYVEYDTLLDRGGGRSGGMGDRRALGECKVDWDGDVRKTLP
jgi:hypothetical protein